MQTLKIQADNSPQKSISKGSHHQQFGYQNQVKLADCTFLSLESMQRNYKQWQCSIETIEHNNVYYKYLQGNGRIQYSNGNIYTGEIFRGFHHGSGQFLWKNTSIKYKGTFNFNQIDGYGQFYYPDGSYYKGQVCNGHRHGNGQFQNKSLPNSEQQPKIQEQYRYTGSWKFGKRQGQGKLHYTQNNSYFEGSWKNDVRQGYGKMFYASGNQFEGNFSNDIKQGLGTMIWRNHHQKYKGQWLENRPHGYGEYYWYQNKTQFKILKNCFKGQWENGSRNGPGIFYYANGCKFEGQFKDNSKNGIGIMTDEYGNIKVGEYVDNRLVGLEQKLQKKRKRQKSVLKSKDSVNFVHERKLPKIKKQLSRNPQFQSDQNTNNTQVYNSINFEGKPVQNPYINYIDFSYPGIRFTNNFYNSLFRLNSRFCSMYKNISACSQENKQYYTGMTLQNYWKAIRQSRILIVNAGDTHQNLSKNNLFSQCQPIISLTEINRLFSKGTKSSFDTNYTAKPQIFQILRSNEKIIEERGYEQIRWGYFMNQLRKLQINKDDGQQQLLRQSDRLIIENLKDKIPGNQIKDCHNPQKIILFRHFVCLICHTAYLLSDRTTKEDTLKIIIQKLMLSIQNSLEVYQQNNNNSKQQKQSIHDSHTQITAQKQLCMPEWTQNIHDTLLNQLTGDKVDSTLLIKQIYSLLESTAVIKDLNEKLIFIQKIQRYLNTRGVFAVFTNISKKQMRLLITSALEAQNNKLQRQQNQNLFKNRLQNLPKLSTYFETIMNYQLNPKQIKQLLFQTLNRKISAASQQEYKKKYQGLIQEMIQFYRSKQISDDSITKNETMLNGELNIDKNRRFKLRAIVTKKDKKREEMIQKDIELKLEEQRKIMMEIQNQRRQKQMRQMEREDWDIGREHDDRNDEDEHESPDYFL